MFRVVIMVSNKFLRLYTVLCMWYYIVTVLYNMYLPLLTKKKVLFAPSKNDCLMSSRSAKCSISLILMKVFPVPVPRQTMIFFPLADSNSSTWYSRGSCLLVVFSAPAIRSTDSWMSENIEKLNFKILCSIL